MELCNPLPFDAPGHQGVVTELLRLLVLLCLMMPDGRQIKEFTAEDPVELLLLTKPYHSSSDFKGKMQAWARKQNLTDTNKVRTAGHRL